MKLLRRTLPVLILISAFGPALSQQTIDGAAPLFMVGGHTVTVGEFTYLYRKNHQHKPEAFTASGIEEYLDLYIRYKLKVAEAIARGMDTTASFRQEYETYRAELLKPYLGDVAMVDSLVAITYDRLKEEIRAAHILVQVSPEAAPDDTLRAWNRIVEARNRALAGEDFGKLAGIYSDEPGAATRGGDLGYFTALQMVFPFEQAAYSTPIGSVSMPVRTRFGYHILKVLDRRPSQGEVEVSHIMIRTGQGEDDGDAKERIFEVHDRLQKGMEWEDVCREFSEDYSTRESGGRLRPFGVGAMNAAPGFQEMAFALERPGDISDPVETPFGWHVLRLESRIPLAPLSEIKGSLSQRVRRDERMNVAVRAHRAVLLRNLDYAERQEAVTAFLQAPSSASDNDELFTLAGHSYSVADFIQFAGDNRIEKSRQQFEAFVDEKVRENTERRVLSESPEFKWLLQEYYEGILLFEIMEKEIWNKALEDSVGQRQYYERNHDRYHAGERIRSLIYSGGDRQGLEEIRRALAEGEAVSDLSGRQAVRLDSGLFERADRQIFSSIPWEQGVHWAEHNGQYYVVNVTEVVAPGPKTFEEARPAVISDYQTYLEDAWIQELKRKFAVRVNKKSRKRATKYLLAVKQQLDR